jgi:hyaluronan synthase
MPALRRWLGLLPALAMVCTLAAVALSRAGCSGWACAAHSWLHSLGDPMLAVGAVHVLYTVVQAVQWAWYRPFERVPVGTLPTLSVIIPAYNEGSMVQVSIRSVLACDYPADRLEVIVIDDGSQDDTFACMDEIARAHPERVRTVRFAQNRGKRAALAAGIEQAQGQVFVTLDSDSVVLSHTLQALVAPLVRDEGVGVVAGRVSVLNQDNVLGRMLQVQYMLAFDFARAAQSSFGTVACAPGALSAYRRALVVPYLQSWLNQTFLGRAVRHGEDQALTNIVLRQGFDSVYQCDAEVRTVAPESYGQLCRMLTRWDRSAIVEGVATAGYIFTGYRSRNTILPTLDFVLGQTRQLARAVGIFALAAAVYQRPDMLPAYTLGFLTTSLCASLYYLWTRRGLSFLYGVLYAVFSLFYLQWIYIWACITVRDERWGTR